MIQYRRSYPNSITYIVGVPIYADLYEIYIKIILTRAVLYHLNILMVKMSNGSKEFFSKFF